MSTTPNTPSSDAKPIILTQVSHSGVSALDLASVPHHILANIAWAALAVVAELGNDNITAGTAPADYLLRELSSAADALDALYTPMVPGREDLMNLGLTVADDDQGYPIMRGEQFMLVKADQLSPIEKAAVRQHLEFNMRAAEVSAGSFRERLTQFEQEIE